MLGENLYDHLHLVKGFNESDMARGIEAFVQEPGAVKAWEAQRVYASERFADFIERTIAKGVPDRVDE